MITDRGIYRSANALIDQHGQDAPILVPDLNTPPVARSGHLMGYRDRKSFGSLTEHTAPPSLR